RRSQVYWRFARRWRVSIAAAAAVSLCYLLVNHSHPDADSVIPRGVLAGDSQAVWGVAFSPDGKTLASWGCGDGGVRLWDAGTARNVGRVGERGLVVLAAAFSPDGESVASVSERGTAIWPLTRGRAPVVLDREPWAIRSIAFSPDG